MGLSAYQAYMAHTSQQLEGKSVDLANRSLRYAETDLAMGKEALKLDRDAFEMSRKNMELDIEGLALARLMHEMEERGLGYTTKGLEHAENSLLCSQADLSRGREWRLVEEKTQQLKAISNLSALIAGFAMVSLVELSIPEDINSGILIVFGLATALVVSAMVVTMLTTSMMLVYILNYRQVTDQPFKKVWANKCEADWRRSFNCFKFGVPCFLVSLGSLSWIKFQTNNEWADIVVSVSVTAVAAVALIGWFTYIKTKYAADPSSDHTPDLEEELEPVRLRRGMALERSLIEKVRQMARKAPKELRRSNSASQLSRRSDSGHSLYTEPPVIGSDRQAAQGGQAAVIAEDAEDGAEFDTPRLAARPGPDLETAPSETI